MAGVTDLPFRNLCYQFGADLCVSEMVTSEKHLWKSRKTRLRLDHTGEKGIRIIQIAGADPLKLADTAVFNVSRGAEIIDINMGCPAKKVCNVQAGSALLKNEKLVADIITAVINAVKVPVTLKIRTGWDRQNKNAVRIARIAEQNGIQAITIHGRTRADAFSGEAEYETMMNILSSPIGLLDVIPGKKKKNLLDQGVLTIFEILYWDNRTLGKLLEKKPEEIKKMKLDLNLSNLLEKREQGIPIASFKKLKSETLKLLEDNGFKFVEDLFLEANMAMVDDEEAKRKIVRFKSLIESPIAFHTELNSQEKILLFFAKSS